MIVKVGTLNFSGTISSPFEYFDGHKDIEKINRIFVKILEKYQRDQKIQMKIDKIDSQLKKQRYSPLYRSEFGVKDRRLINKEQFNQIWNIQFESHKNLLSDRATGPKQIQQIKIFDWMCYQALLNNIYNPHPEVLMPLQKLLQQNVIHFIASLRYWHSKIQMNNRKRDELIKQAIKKFDVLCLQEINNDSLLELQNKLDQNYKIQTRSKSKSVIIYNATKFKQDVSTEAFDKQFFEKLNFNKDSVYVKLKNVLLISGHFTSKSQHKQQAAQMFEIFKQIKLKHPNLQIIAGIDANHFIEPQKYPQYHITPKTQDIPTNIKKRTSMQCQFEKSNLYVSNVKDIVITTASIVNSQIGTIDGFPVHKSMYLPNNQHPFDHFLVSATLSTRPSSLFVGQLNFSGISLSPFEYHDDSAEKRQLSQLFNTIVTKYYPEKDFSWSVGKIDQLLQVERYTPVYNAHVGIQNGKLINRQQFNTLWNSNYQLHKKAFKQKDPTEQQIESARMFDWISYETILNYIYKTSNIENLDPTHYVDFMKLWHSKKYLNNHKKMYEVKRCLNDLKLDILFLEEARVKQSETWTQVLGQQYQIVQQEGKQSAIIFKKVAIEQDPDRQAFEQIYRQRLNINEDTIIYKSKSFLLVAAHLSSKSNKYGDQEKQLFEVLGEIKTNYAGLEIILGMDSNHFVNPKNHTFINVFPPDQTKPTNSKMRTNIQVQTSKANVIAANVKDQIVSTLQIHNGEIRTIRQKKIDSNMLLPTDDHPFDHFLLTAQLQ